MSWTKNAVRAALLTAGLLAAGTGTAAADAETESAVAARLAPTIEAMAKMFNPVERVRNEPEPEPEPEEEDSTPGRPRLQADPRQEFGPPMPVERG